MIPTNGPVLGAPTHHVVPLLGPVLMAEMLGCHEMLVLIIFDNKTIQYHTITIYYNIHPYSGCD